MKKYSVFIFFLTFFAFIIIFSSCKSKQNDVAITQAIENSLDSDSLSKNKSVIFENGTATITGDCKDENCLSHCAQIAASISGVKKVINNCTITKKEIVATTPDDVLVDALNNAMNSYAGVSGYVEHGKYIISGKIDLDKWLSLREMLDMFKPNGYKLDGLTINK